MNLSFFIAKRYLISKKSHNAIHTISLISVLGVAIAVSALVCTLSVYNGFQQLLGSLYSSFDPQIKIVSSVGKSFRTDTESFQRVRSHPDVAVFSESIEENALIQYKQAQTNAKIKGVDSQFAQLTQIDQLMQKGRFRLHEDDFEYATLGVGLASLLGTGTSFIDPITILVPRRTTRINLANPTASFKQTQILIGGTFGLNQPEYDNQYILLPLSFAKELFEYDNEVTSVEIKLRSKANPSASIKSIKRTLGSDYQVLSLMEQKADFYRINRIEKWMTFLILSFILLIALFNVVGSLSMLILEKKKDATILHQLGMPLKNIRQTFITEGRLIAASGAVLGLVFGVGLCLLQQSFGFLRLGGGGNYIVEAYPIVVKWIDLFLILITVVLISLPTTWWPVQLYFKQHENKKDA